MENQQLSAESLNQNEVSNGNAFGDHPFVQSGGESPRSMPPPPVNLGGGDTGMAGASDSPATKRFMSAYRKGLFQAAGDGEWVPD